MEPGNEATYPEQRSSRARGRPPELLREQLAEESCHWPAPGTGGRGKGKGKGRGKGEIYVTQLLAGRV